MWSLNYITKGDKVLFVGCGTAEESVEAVKLGANVVLIDVSETMLQQAEAKLKKTNSTSYEIIQDDVMNHTGQHVYDVVVANYFLDVFNEETMKEMLMHLQKLVRKDGKLILSGFAPVKGWSLSRLITEFLHAVPIVVFHFLCGNALHRIYDYSGVLVQSGWEIQEKKNFFLFKNYLPVTESIYATHKQTI